MRSKSQILSKLRADGHITDEEYKLLEQEPKMVHRETFEQVMWERDVAINQLKELGYRLGEKIKTDKDAISRQAVLELAYTIPDEYFGTREVVSAEKIKELPPVNPQPKTGHWIYKPMEGQFCSICDEQSVWKFNYCPNCGAKMEVSE